MHRSLIWTLAALTFLACGGGGSDVEPDDAATTGAASGEAPSDVAQEALERFAERAEGIESFTLVQEVGGQETTERYVKTVTADGFPVFRPEGVPAAEAAAMDDLAAMLRRAREEGRAEVEGVDTHVLVIDDFTGLPLGGADSAAFRPERMALYVDTDEYLPRRMEMKGAVAMGDESRPITTTVTLSDYRTIEGFAYPFRTTMRTEGMSAAMDPAQLEAAKRQLEETERQLAAMPEGQRQMAEQAMGAQLETMRRMVDGDPIEQTVVVKDLKVNTPAGS